MQNLEMPSVVGDIWSQAPGLSFENEAAVETRLILPLLRALGYSETDHIAPKYPVIFQEGRQGRRPEADFVVFAERPHSRATSLLTIEAKHPDEELTGGKEQGESYAANVRSPLLMMSNGRQIQLWQFQPTYESELVLECSVAELPSRRGQLEALLAREAILAHAGTMRHKSFGLLARDLGAYERAEFERNDGVEILISRRLKDAGGGSIEVSSTALLATYPNGVVILAASGYGKTTLARELRQQAFERRWSGESSRLPIEVFLPDVPPSPEGLEAFLCSRVAVHCPQVSSSAFRDHLRNDGIVLLGDGFDRVSSEHRSKLESAIVTFRRDFPKTQLLLFTRAISCPERVATPSIELLDLSFDEQRDLVEQFSIGEGYTGSSFWYYATDVLRAVCRHPLILQLTLAHYKEQGHLPTRIETLFQTWLNRLFPNSLPLARRSDLKELLTVFANATVNGPLTEDAAVTLVRSQGYSDDLLQLLLDTDALAHSGTTVELQHEALADYVRALDVVKLQPPDALHRLRSLSLREGSQLPALLMAVAKNAELQRLIWKEIVSADIRAAIAALRYCADLTSPSNSANLNDLSQQYLSEIIEGIELPLGIYFQRLSARIRLDLVGSDAELLGIIGAVQPEDGRLGYSFIARAPLEDKVTVGRAEGAGRYFGRNLLATGLRLDSGRLVGMGHILSGLLDLVKERRLDGGIVWAEERTLSRLHHLVREYGLPYVSEMTLEQAKELFIRQAGQWVVPNAFRSGQTFAIDDLVAEIEFLITRGRTHLNPWWAEAGGLDLTTSEGRVKLGRLLDVHYQRTQLAYREIVETSFPSLATKLPFYQVMPVRYEIEVEFHNRSVHASETLHWRWVPVATLDDIGATTAFPSQPSEMWSEAAFDIYQKRIDEALAQYGRPAPDRQYTCGQKGIPDFANAALSQGGQVDETSVLCAASELIENDLKKLFDELPATDKGSNLIHRLA